MGLDGQNGGDEDEEREQAGHGASKASRHSRLLASGFGLRENQSRDQSHHATAQADLGRAWNRGLKPGEPEARSREPEAW
jgi:hypothetical protein